MKIKNTIFNQITLNPFDRIPDAMKQVIKTKNPIFDVHCHIFNKDNVPDKYLGIKIPLTQAFLDSISHFLKNLIPNNDNDKFSNLGYFIDVFNNLTMEEIFIKFLDYYADSNVIFCALMMNMESYGNSGIKGKLAKKIDIQLNEMKEMRDKYPDKILPFLAINPNNPDLDEIIKKAFSDEYNFFGIKIYPSLGYLPTHPNLMKVFAMCEEKNIPVITHCGNADVHTSYHYFKTIDGNTEQKKKYFLSINDYAKYFNNPVKWELVLKSFPKLRLNFGHFGGFEEWEKFSTGNNNTWVSRIIDYMNKYENVYADLSFNIFDKKIFDLYKRMLSDNKLIRERTLYGSDYYMVVSKGHFRSMKTDFFSFMGDEIINQIAYNNPIKYLGLDNLTLKHKTKKQKKV